MKSIVNTIKFYCSQIALIIIIFLPCDVMIRGLMVLSLWTIYCTVQLIINRKNASRYYHYEERRKRNRETINFAINYRDNT